MINWIKKIFKKEYKFKYFEVHLTEHCNLNCQSCFHFSPLADEEYADKIEFEEDFKRLAYLAQGRIESLVLMGGEPLLHPECTDFFEIARKHFPKAYIQFVTNGILLKEQSNSFWESMKKNSIVLRPTKYPIDIEWGKIENTCKEYDIKLEYFNNITQSFKIPIKLDGRINIKNNHKRCGSKTCYILKNRKIYPCSIAANIHHFIKFFNLEINNSSKNGIDIYKAKNIDEINSFLLKPIPMCEYCNGSRFHIYKLWARSKKDINEWIE